MLGTVCVHYGVRMGTGPVGRATRRAGVAVAAVLAVSAITGTGTAGAVVPGFLSDGFGTTGTGFTVTNVGAADNVGAIRDLDVAPDGKIVSGGFEESFGIAVTRHTKAGVLDTSFSGDGVATLDADLVDSLDDSSPDPFTLEWGGLVVDDEGRVYVQVAYFDSINTEYRDVVVRFTAAGDLDAAFSGGISSVGYTTANISPATTAGVDLAPGGGVVSAVAYESGGLGFVATRIVTEAGGAGPTSTQAVGDPSPTVSDLATDLDAGRVYVLGNHQNNATNTADVLRLDSSLSTQGVSSVPGVSQVTTDRVLAAPGGGFVVSGTAAGGASGFVARLDATGNAVTGFDGDGIVQMPGTISGASVTNPNLWSGMTFDGEDLVVAGSFTDGLTDHVAVGRYNSDGSPDSGLDPGGAVAISHLDENSTILDLGSNPPILGGPPVALTSDGVAVVGVRVVRGGKVRFGIVGFGPDLAPPGPGPGPGGGGGGGAPGGGGGSAPGAVSLQLLNAGVTKTMPDLLKAPYANLGPASLTARLNAEGFPVSLQVRRLKKAAALKLLPSARPNFAVRQSPAAGTVVRGSALGPISVFLEVWDPVLDVAGTPRCTSSAVVTRRGRDPLTLAEALKGAEFAPGARVEGAANELLDRFNCDFDVNFAYSARATRTTVTAVRFKRIAGSRRFEVVLTVTRPRLDTDFMVTYSEGDGVTKGNRVPLGADAKLTRNVGNELTVAVRETATGAVADNALVEVFAPGGENVATARANVRGVAVLNFVPRRAGEYDVYVTRARFNAPTAEEVRQEYLMSLGSVVRRQAFTSVGGARYVKRGSGFARAASASQVSGAAAAVFLAMRQALVQAANAFSVQIAQANRLTEAERVDVERLYRLLLGVPLDAPAGLPAAGRTAGFRPAIATASGGTVVPALRPAQIGLAQLPGIGADGVAIGRAEGLTLGRGSGVLINDNGTVIGPDGQPMGTQRLIANDGASLISDHGAGLIANDGASLVSDNGGGLIANDGASLIANDGASLIANDGASFVPTSKLLGGQLVGNAGGTLVGNAGGTLVGNAGGTFSPLSGGTTLLSSRGG